MALHLSANLYRWCKSRSRTLWLWSTWHYRFITLCKASFHIHTCVAKLPQKKIQIIVSHTRRCKWRRWLSQFQSIFNYLFQLWRLFLYSFIFSLQIKHLSSWNFTRYVCYSRTLAVISWEHNFPTLIVIVSIVWISEIYSQARIFPMPRITNKSLKLSWLLNLSRIDERPNNSMRISENEYIDLHYMSKCRSMGQAPIWFLDFYTGRYSYINQITTQTIIYFWNMQELLKYQTVHVYYTVKIARKEQRTEDKGRTDNKHKAWAILS